MIRTGVGTRTRTETRVAVIKMVMLQFSRIPHEVGLRADYDLSSLDQILERSMISSKALRALNIYFWKRIGDKKIAKGHVYFRMNWHDFDSFVEIDGKTMSLFNIDDPADGVSPHLKRLYELVLNVARSRDFDFVDWWIDLRYETDAIAAISRKINDDFNLQPPDSETSQAMTDLDRKVRAKTVKTRGFAPAKTKGFLARVAFDL